MEPSLTLEYTEEGTLAERMDAIREARFPAVNLYTGICKQLMQGPEDETRSLKNQLSERGLEVDWVHAPYAQTILYDANIEISAIMIGALKSAILIAKELNAVSLVVHPFNIKFPEDVDKGASLDQLVYSFRILTEYAKGQGVHIAVENIDEPYSTNILPILFEEISDLRFCFDTGHAFKWQTYNNYLPQYADRIVALHIHDNHGKTDEHLIPGDGIIDYTPMLEALETNEHCKYLGIECVQKVTKYSGGLYDLPFKIQRRMGQITGTL